MSSVSYLTELAYCFLENEAPAFVEVAEFEDWPVINKFFHVKVDILKRTLNRIATVLIHNYINA